MNATSSVYVLDPNVTDPRFDGFVYAAVTPSVLGYDDACDDLSVDDGESLDWRPRPIKSVWKPINVEGPVNAFNDYPCLELVTPVFSHRAVDAFGEMLTENGELLPLKTNDGEYYAYVCLTKLDALNVKKSRMHRTKSSKTALAIDYFAFKKSRLAGATIFRVREHPNIHLVTEQFKERAERAALNGLNFIKVWPLPEDSDWDMEEAIRRRTNKTVTLVGQALTVCFRLKKEIPSAVEKAAAIEIENLIREKLRPPTVQDKYWGSVERTEFVEGELRVVCTCPDCDELATHLQDWIEEIDWSDGVAVIKRYGNLFWGRPKQKRVELRKPKS